MLLALCVGQMRGTVDDATVERIVRELKNMPLYIKDVLGLADKIKNLSKIYTYARNFLYLGRGYNYPTALEGALKLKEISYIHAEGYPAAEMKIVKKEALKCSGKIYSEQHRRNFDIKDDILRVENDPDDESRLNLTINRKPIADWFREQWHRLRYGARVPQQEERKSRGFKL